ncbi:putative transmembrane protein [Tetrahymena thermophila SB210]|uniref:Putative transmembrane protein n=1 Tax=Tetrahymena thermophila (strain SB210) TaxID=312017 RepID=A0A1B9C275_TETTS|nr:putative transmembrane protein [Tetrahymena thermophila SB210]
MFLQFKLFQKNYQRYNQKNYKHNNIYKYFPTIHSYKYGCNYLIGSKQPEEATNDNLTSIVGLIQLICQAKLSSNQFIESLFEVFLISLSSLQDFIKSLPIVLFFENLNSEMILSIKSALKQLIYPFYLYLETRFSKETLNACNSSFYLQQPFQQQPVLIFRKILQEVSIYSSNLLDRLKIQKCQFQIYLQNQILLHLSFALIYFEFYLSIYFKESFNLLLFLFMMINLIVKQIFQLLSLAYIYRVNYNQRMNFISIKASKMKILNITKFLKSISKMFLNILK